MQERADIHGADVGSELREEEEMRNAETYAIGNGHLRVAAWLPSHIKGKV